MVRLLILSLLTILITANFTSASIINVPADYDVIQEAINASSDGDTVLVAEGHYFERINFLGKGILLTSEFIWEGDTTHIYNTIIDADTSVLGITDTNSVICFGQGEDSNSVIKGFIIQNGIGTTVSWTIRDGGGIFCYNSSPTISNNLIANNSANYQGGGIICDSLSNPTIINNIITGNSAEWGGGILCDGSSPVISFNSISENSADNGGGIESVQNSSPTIHDNLIWGNSAELTGGGIDCIFCDGPIVISHNLIYGNSAEWGGGIQCYGSSLIIRNNTITENPVNSLGGGIYCGVYGTATVINSIVWANADGSGENEIGLTSFASISISYSDVHGGWEGDGNINADPLYVDPENGDYRLLAGSPCIDTGDPDSPFDPDSTRADMGAFYFDQYVDIDLVDLLPTDFHLHQNYPNPFNASTTIEYELPYPEHVLIDIYDILGRRLATIVDLYQSAGYHQVIWQASNFSSGLFFCRIQAGDYTKTMKMQLIK
ncbi:MAG: T9SS type A sorting domain-containing protein [candidate division Zixibacteria bacterium]|nr:T9SS type A sorting domain-containing protein [candidate division Zixibacteria bacterium]